VRIRVDRRRRRDSFDLTVNSPGPTKPTASARVVTSPIVTVTVTQGLEKSAYNKSITDTHVEQRYPILDGLQREAGKDHANSEDAHPLLGHMIRGPFDERRT
jgi:hypothetical protein